jgi:hypothetical protein
MASGIASKLESKLKGLTIDASTGLSRKRGEGVLFIKLPLL